MSNAVGKGIMLMFGLMICAGIIYLYVSGEFYEFDLITKLADDLGTTPHAIALFFAITIMAFPFIILPLIIVVVAYTR